MKITGLFKHIVLFSLIVLIFLLSSVVSLAQDYARVKILSGGSPTFIFNSLKKYTDGITLTSWTKLRLELNNETATGWELSVMALNPRIESDGSANLNLDRIQVRVESFDLIENTSILDYTSPVILSVNPGEVIIKGNNAKDVAVEISLSYDCGTDSSNQLMGEVPDYYFVDLVYNLYSVP